MRHETTESRRRGFAGEAVILGTMVRIIYSGKQALDAVMLKMGCMVA